VWGLGANGEKGVDDAIAFIQRELDVSMALTGCNSISDITLDRLVLTRSVREDFGISA
jgi:isopentenyl diphosphate isomerase/L-lactate dehydrogenase-like FMN-dependent dehydrogenase